MTGHSPKPAGYEGLDDARQRVAAPEPARGARVEDLATLVVGLLDIHGADAVGLPRRARAARAASESMPRRSF